MVRCSCAWPGTVPEHIVSAMGAAAALLAAMLPPGTAGLMAATPASVVSARLHSSRSTVPCTTLVFTREGLEGAALAAGVAQAQVQAGFDRKVVADVGGEHAVGEHRHLVLPYAFDTNDMQFQHTQRFDTADSFAQYVCDAVDWLALESERAPRMMSVGLHLRMIGRPARMKALDRILARPANLLDSLEVHQSPLARIASDHLPLKARLDLSSARLPESLKTAKAA